MMRRSIAAATALSLAMTLPAVPAQAGSRVARGVAAGAAIGIGAAILGTMLSRQAQGRGVDRGGRPPRGRDKQDTRKGRGKDGASGTATAEQADAPQRGRPGDRTGPAPTLQAVLQQQPPLPSRASYRPDPARVAPVVLVGGGALLGAQLANATAPVGIDGGIDAFVLDLRRTANVTLDRTSVARVLDDSYAAGQIARLEGAFAADGWSREVLELRMLRVARASLPRYVQEFGRSGDTQLAALRRIFDAAGAEALATAMLEQEATAFSASLRRYAEALSKPGAEPPKLPLTAVDVRGLSRDEQVQIPSPESSLAMLPLLLTSLDREIERRGLGLRGKLRARTIMLDCLTEEALAGAGASPPAAGTGLPGGADVQYAVTTPLKRSGEACNERLWSYFGKVDRLQPTPAEAVWTASGPVLDGRMWDFRFDQG